MSKDKIDDVAVEVGDNESIDGQDSVTEPDAVVENEVENEAGEKFAELDAELDAVALQQQVTDLKDQYLRAKAEMDNVRRRTDKQIADSRKFAVEGFAKEMLGVRDSLQLAAEVDIEVEDSDAVTSMKEGLALTLKQLDGVFTKFAIEEIAPQAGDKLDPHLHQAMTMVPTADVEPGHVLSTMQKGYQLNERLLRPAMVIVAKAL